jgi:hypothetical protein
VERQLLDGLTGTDADNRPPAVGNLLAIRLRRVTVPRGGQAVLAGIKIFENKLAVGFGKHSRIHGIRIVHSVSIEFPHLLGGENLCQPYLCTRQRFTGRSPKHDTFNGSLCRRSEYLE